MNGFGNAVRRRLVAGLALVVLVSVAACGRSGAPSPPAERVPRIAGTETVGPRVRDLVVDSPALGQHVLVRLLLPRHFEAEPDRRWPVLWLLHGCCDSYESWTRSTDLEALPGLDEVLVVMPDGGQVGFYSDWLDGSTGGPARWETFHLTELRQLLERDWRAGPRRAVAGLSMGGLGAMAYAARHPGMFQAAASYSGLLHTRYDGAPSPGAPIVQNLLGTFGEDPAALWGDPARNAGVWAAHNPHDLAPRLRGVALFVSAGNGQPGPLDGPAPNAQAQQIEADLYPQASRSWNGLASSASPSVSTITAPAPTTGPTGSGRCAVRCLCCWTPSAARRVRSDDRICAYWRPSSSARRLRSSRESSGFSAVARIWSNNET